MALFGKKRRSSNRKYGRARVLGNIVIEIHQSPGLIRRQHGAYVGMILHGDPAGPFGGPVDTLEPAPMIQLVGAPDGLFDFGDRVGLDQYIGLDRPAFLNIQRRSPLSRLVFGSPPSAQITVNAEEVRRVVAMALQYLNRGKLPPAPRPIAESTWNKKHDSFLEWQRAVRENRIDPAMPFSYTWDEGSGKKGRKRVIKPMDHPLPMFRVESFKKSPPAASKIRKMVDKPVHFPYEGREGGNPPLFYASTELTPEKAVLAAKDSIRDYAKEAQGASGSVVAIAYLAEPGQVLYRAVWNPFYSMA